MPFGAIRDLEEMLKEQISDSRGSPFIAHYDVPRRREEAALKEIVNAVRGDLSRFLKLMSPYPCVCARVLATSLAESYGDEGDSQVYGLLAKRLCVGKTIQLGHRHTLNERFRNCCQILGLALPPRTTMSSRMVDDYLFQAGVSHSQLPMLAFAFLRAERLFGLPRGDDTREIDDWEDRAVEFAPPGLAVLRRIVRGDPSGYHATAFIRLRREGSPSSASSFERAFEAATQSPATSAHGGNCADPGPGLEFSSGDLWLALPRGAKRLEVTIRNRVHPLSGGRKLALSMPWPETIAWRRPYDGTSSTSLQQLRLFSHHRRILVFDGDSGILKCDLDPAVPSGQRIPAGQLCLLSQSYFETNKEPSHCLGNEAFVLFCEVSTELIVRHDGHRCEVDVDPRLRLQVDGNRIVRNRDAWLVAGPIAVRVWGEMGSSSQGLEVSVTHPALDGELRSPIRGTSDGSAFAKLNMPTNGEFGIARASLHIRGQERALYRTKFWFWPGLSRLVQGRVFEAESIPENLAEEYLSYITRGSHGHLELQEDEAYLQAKLCFQVNRRIVRFNLPPPGASISIRRADGSERPLRMGVSLAVREDYASSLIVRCSDPTAAIDLKGQVIPKAFGRVGSWRVSFAALKQEGKHNRVRLLRSGQLDSAAVLVTVVPEAEPKYFKVRRVGTRRFYEAGFERRVDAVRIEAENLIFGERLVVDSALDPPPHNIEVIPLAKAFRETGSDGAERVQIELDGNDFSDGVWFVRFAIREPGRKEWLPVINYSGESYAACVASESYTVKLAYESVSDWCPAERAQAFLRLTRVIDTPVSRECRTGVEDLALGAWRRIGESLAGGSPADQASLLKACAGLPLLHAREGWLPVHHPVEVAPDLFAISAEEFGVIASSEVHGYQEFESVGLAGITESLQDAVDLLDVSHAFLFAFKNATKLQEDASASPGAFDFSRYCELAATLDDNKPLSISHHHQACERMADRVAIVSMDSFSSVRLAKAMSVLRHFVPLGVGALDVPDDLAGEFALVKATPPLIAALAQAWRNGDTSRFWCDVASTVDRSEETVRKYVGSILRLAPELLAFYLMLWVLVQRNSE